MLSPVERRGWGVSWFVSSSTRKKRPGRRTVRPAKVVRLVAGLRRVPRAQGRAPREKSWEGEEARGGWEWTWRGLHSDVSRRRRGGLEEEEVVV